MKDKKSAFTKFTTGRGFYLTAAVCLCLIAAAIGVIYRSSANLMKDYVSQENTTFDYHITEQAEADKDDEPDPRFETEEITQEQETEEATEEVTSAAVPQIEENEEPQVSQPVAAINNASYTLPVTEDILKDYSETPVYDETMGDWRVHKGIDFVCDEGTQIFSAGNGKVTKVYSDTSYGYCIEVDHGDFVGRYCGLEQGTTVKLDDEVKKGDVIGNSGKIPCEGQQPPHFHFEAVKDGVNIDPLAAMRK